jgi:hypothetical protein
MRRLGFALTALALVAGAPALAHRATERYIPIGASPGVSGKVTYIGVVESMDRAARTVRVKDGERSLGMTCNEKTRFWLDRSKLRKTNLEGSIADCQPGRRIEIRFVDDDREAAVAAWVKIEITED